jgi:putative sterol carrier protein
MSDTVDAAVKALAARLDGRDMEGSIKFVISGEGAVRIDEAGVTADAADADCTITADTETFQELLAGDLDPTAAFMSGRLAIEGDMGLAMRLASALG